MKILATIFCGLFFVNPAMAKSIAVTDLAYSETIEQYVHTVDYHNSSKFSESSSDKFSRESVSNKTDFHESERNFSYIEFDELKKFTGDIKGQLINSHQFKIVQAKPAPTKKDESVYNIIARIKKGDFPHADYVLFGRLSDLSFNSNAYSVNDDMMNSVLSLTLTAEFSLINTKTYEITAGFSATGDGQDTKILSPGTQAMPNRAAVVSQVSKSLGQDVFRQIEEQVFDQVSGEPTGRSSNVDSHQNNGIEPPPQKPQGVTVFE
ncbi:MAG: penicillin-binding protein activator LpoB [Methylococcaceae bacterium]|nr:penicillin-binding protein activator LpoB [Methylococcaceae bacterium]